MTVSLTVCNRLGIGLEMGLEMGMGVGMRNWDGKWEWKGTPGPRRRQYILMGYHP